MFRYLVLALLPLFLLVGCSSSENKVKPPTEIKPPTDVNLVEGPELELFNEGQRLFQSGLYSIARDSFESLRVNYPLSPYAEYAELKVGDCLFESSEYPAAAMGFEEFSKNRPTSEAVPYALLMAGRSSELTAQGLGRDTAPLHKALEFYSRVQKQFPDTAYAVSAAKYSNKIKKSLANYEKLVRNYYRKKGNTEAAEIRDRAYQEVKASVEQTPKLENEKLGVLNASFQTVTIPKPIRAEVANVAANPISSVADLVQRVECKLDDKLAILYLNRTLPLSDLSRVSPNVFKLSSADVKELKFDCFGKEDLRISKDGLLTVANMSAIEVSPVANPPRLILFPTS